MKKKCLVCKTVKTIKKQGVCHKCYNKLERAVESGQDTWQALIATGRILAPQKRHKKKNDKTQPATDLNIKPFFANMHKILDEVEALCSETVTLHKRFMKLRENMLKVSTELHKSEQLRQDLLKGD